MCHRVLGTRISPARRILCSCVGCLHAVIKAGIVLEGLYFYSFFTRAVAHVADVGTERSHLDARVVLSIQFTQGLIAFFHEVPDIILTPKVAETIVQHFVANLCVFVTCQGVIVL